MSDFLQEVYFLVCDQLPEAKSEGDWEAKLRATLTPEQTALFEEYRGAEFDREEADRQMLFRFLLHIP